MNVISLSNGFFQLNAAFSITPYTTSQELIAHFSSDDFKTNQYGNGHSNYVLRNIEINALHFIITVYFQKELLTSISFICRNKPYPEVPSWDDFNADEADKESLFLRSWIIEQIGSELGEYDWGKIGVYYDFHNHNTYCKVDYSVEE